MCEPHSRVHYPGSSYEGGWEDKAGGRVGGAKGAPGPHKFGTPKPSAFSINAQSRFMCVVLIGVLGPHSHCDLLDGALVFL